MILEATLPPVLIGLIAAVLAGTGGRNTRVMLVAGSAGALLVRGLAIHVFSFPTIAILSEAAVLYCFLFSGLETARRRGTLRIVGAVSLAATGMVTLVPAVGPIVPGAAMAAAIIVCVSIFVRRLDWGQGLTMSFVALAIVGAGLAISSSLGQSGAVGDLVTFWLYLLVGGTSSMVLYRHIGGLNHAVDRLERVIKGVARTEDQSITSAIDDIDTALSMVASDAIRTIEAEGGELYLLEESEEGLHLTRKAMIEPLPRLFDHGSSDSINPATSKATRYLNLRSPLSIDADDSNTPYRLVTPLQAGSSVIGLMAYSKTRTPFDAIDENIADYLGRHFAARIHNEVRTVERFEQLRIRTEIDIAAEIQKRLLPQTVIDAGAASISLSTTPAKGIHSDYHDLIKGKAGQLSAILCDVTGKSVPASVVMIMIRSMFRLLATGGFDPATILSWINSGIARERGADYFASATVVQYAEHERRIRFASAGFTPLLICRLRNQQIEQHEAQGNPLGVDRTRTYDTGEIAVDRGDICVLYSDGVVETMDEQGDVFGIDRLTRLIQESYFLSAQDLSGRIVRELESYRGNAPRRDDQSLIIVKVY